MTKSDSTLERLKHAGGEPVTWKGLAQTGLVVGSLVSGIWLARESSQDAAIAAKADEAEIARSLDRVEARMERLAADLTTLFMKFIKVAEATADQNESPHVIGQVQQQEIHLDDMVSQAAKQHFALQWQRKLKTEFGPCVIGDGEDVLQRLVEPMAVESDGTGDRYCPEGGCRVQSGGVRSGRSDVPDGSGES